MAVHLYDAGKKLRNNANDQMLDDETKTMFGYQFVKYLICGPFQTY